MSGVTLVDWRPEMLAATVDVLSRAFATNPLHVAAFGKDSVLEKNRAFFQAALSTFRGRRLVAVDGSRIVGFIHWVESPGCRFSWKQRARLVPVMLRKFGPGATVRLSAWLSSWAKNDSSDAHWHIGPIGVDPDVQGKGIGRRMMDACCTSLDDNSANGVLETDKPENVRFYRKFGFEVVKEVNAIGVKTFFMARRHTTRNNDA
jgi:ribosomal protein S18 acetylase RimI-like enzyme